jgi:ion channel-forming bestrophin family protein
MFFTKDNFWFVGLKGTFRAPTWRALWSSLVIVFIYYFILRLLAERYFDFSFHIPGFVVYMLGYVIAILFYFRLNNSYYRWNDGYKSLAYLRANADSLTMKVRAYLKDHPEEIHYLTSMMKNFARAMRDIVRNFQDPKGMIEAQPDMIAKLENVYHLPSRVNSLLEERINKLYQKKIISRAQFLDLNRCVVKNSEHLSSAEALKGTPPPKAYIVHIRGFILSYMLMIPFGFIHEIGVWMLLFLIVFFYFYAGLEIISDIVEDPFGFDADDLPVEPLTVDLERRVDGIINTSYQK